MHYSPGGTPLAHQRSLRWPFLGLNDVSSHILSHLIHIHTYIHTYTLITYILTYIHTQAHLAFAFVVMADMDMDMDDGDGDDESDVSDESDEDDDDDDASLDEEVLDVNDDEEEDLYHAEWQRRVRVWRNRRRLLAMLAGVGALQEDVPDPEPWHRSATRPRTMQDAFDMFTDHHFLNETRFRKDQLVYLCA